MQSILALTHMTFIGERLPHKERNQRKQSCHSHAILTLASITAEAEKVHIEKTLKATKGNKTNTAMLLGISRKTLWKKIKEYHIES